MTPRHDYLRQAMRLMQGGDLQAATRTLQEALGGVNAPASTSAAQTPTGAAAPAAPYIEGEFSVVGEDQTRSEARTATRAGVDGRQRFSCAAGELEYLLHLPPGVDPAGAPLLVMLHGCTQTPEDFARGTRMNQLAQAMGWVVAWPAQSTERNPNRCWNWFRGSDQQRGAGEPALIAALTRHLVDTYRLDPDRVYVAGLSAGGAMAAVLASTHPDIYAAIGVHSGLPIGLAHDVPSAFAAMRKGGKRRRQPVPASADPVPAIVFHGDSDATVHPGNAQGVVEQSLGADSGSAAVSSVEQGVGAGIRSATRTVHRMPDGRVAAEHWLIHGAGHAWSGGDASGSYTDPRGPDASAQMLRFFANCRRR